MKRTINITNIVNTVIFATVLVCSVPAARATDPEPPPGDLAVTYSGLVFSDATHGYVFSEDPHSALIATDDGGQRWRLVIDFPFGGQKGRLDSTAFIDAQTFWLMSSKDDLYSSSDGGRTLSVSQPTFLSHETGQPERVGGTLFFRSPTLGWVGACGRHVLRTTDGGQIWTGYLLPEAVGYIGHVWFFSDTEGIGIGSSVGGVLRTVDGGTKWSRVDGSPDLRSVSCVSSGFCAGFKDMYRPVYVSRDRGQSWQEVHVPLLPGGQDEVRAVQAFNSSLVIVVGSDTGRNFDRDVAPYIGTGTPLPGSPVPRGLMLKWDGANWTRVTYDQPWVLETLSFVDPQNGWVVGSDPNLIYKTTDGGQTLQFVPDYFRQIAALTPNPTPLVVPTPPVSR